METKSQEKEVDHSQDLWGKIPDQKEIPTAGAPEP